MVFWEGRKYQVLNREIWLIMTRLTGGKLSVISYSLRSDDLICS